MGINMHWLSISLSGSVIHVAPGAYLSIWLLQIAHSTTFPTTRAAPALRVTALGLQQLLE